MSKQFEIFKAGTRTSADGTVWHISAADVARAAAVYDPAKHEAPIVIGHPKMDAPAYGWVPALSAASGSLSAEFAQMDADFAEAVASKYESGEIEQACILVNNGTETQWFQRMLGAADAVCFPKTRIKFIDPDGNPSGAPLQGQAILYMGGNVAAFTSLFAEEGVVLTHA